MHLLLSGEGSSDLGLFCQHNNQFIAGSMYYIVDKLIEQKLDLSYYDYKDDWITFIPKVELVKRSKKMSPYTSKKDGKGTGLFVVNAVALAQIAKEKSRELDEEVVAILFRDSDGTTSDSRNLWKNKLKSINRGFQIENFSQGVAMVPKPKSEAWLICALKNTPYQNCAKLENRSGNDKSPDNLKDELKSFGISNEEMNTMIQDGRIDFAKIDMPSFINFRNRLNELL